MKAVPGRQRFLSHVMRTSVFLLLTLGWSTFSFAERFVYVSAAGDEQILTYRFDEESGDLSRLGSLTVCGEPGALCLDPTGRYLFASIKSVGNVASFRVVENGLLEPISEVPAGADPSFLSTDPSGRFLLTSYYKAGKVAVHSIGDDGKLSEQPLQTIVTDDKAHGVTFDRSGEFVFVPHTGPNAIFQFRFDGDDGSLSANDPPQLNRSDSTGPRHLSFRPDGKFAYGSDEQGSSVTVYQLNPRDGTLDDVQTVSTLPVDAPSEGRNSTSHVDVHPNGKSVYVANRGHDSIAAFAVDGATGRLRRRGNTPTEKTPRSFDVDDRGRFLIAAGQNANKLTVYKIKEDGNLRKIGTQETGARPWWVLISR